MHSRTRARYRVSVAAVLAGACGGGLTPAGPLEVKLLNATRVVTSEEITRDVTLRVTDGGQPVEHALVLVGFSPGTRIDSGPFYTDASGQAHIQWVIPLPAPTVKLSACATVDGTFCTAEDVLTDLGGP